MFWALKLFKKKKNRTVSGRACCWSLAGCVPCCLKSLDSLEAEANRQRWGRASHTGVAPLQYPTSQNCAIETNVTHLLKSDFHHRAAGWAEARGHWDCPSHLLQQEGRTRFPLTSPKQTLTVWLVQDATTSSRVDCGKGTQARLGGA